MDIGGKALIRKYLNKRVLSIKKSLIYYIVISSLLSVIISIGVMNGARIIQNSIWSKYKTIEEYKEIYDFYNKYYGYITEAPRISSSFMSQSDNIIVEICDFLETWTLLIITITLNSITSYLFFKRKLKKPLALLEKGANEIFNNNLDFEIEYDYMDEFGKLCKSFDKMRIQLIDNNQKMWNRIIEEKEFHASIAHDIRVPLMVLEGYVETILEFYPEDNISKEEVLAELNKCNVQIARLKEFVEYMRRADEVKLRDRKDEKVSALKIIYDIEEENKVFYKKNGIDIKVQHNQFKEDFEINIDKFIFLEIYENIITNAIRFANSEVSININIEDEQVILIVKDDGCGFESKIINEIDSEKIRKNRNYASGHMGMGLYITKLLCDKYDGDLKVYNSADGGAIVTITLYL